MGQLWRKGEDQEKTLQKTMKTTQMYLSKLARAVMEHMAKILNEIKDFLQDSHKQLQDIKEELNKSNKRIEEAEHRIDEAETRIQNTEEVLEEMLQLTEQIEARLNDQEGRARRSNIKIYGVPEKAEENSSDMVPFLEEFLKSTLDLNPPVDLQIERAHRALAPNPPTTAKPRSIIAIFLNYRTRVGYQNGLGEEGDRMER